MKLGPNLTGNLAMCQIIDPDGHKPGMAILSQELCKGLNV